MTGTSDFFRQQEGFDERLKLPEDPAQRQKSLDNLVAIMRTGKFHATYWLGLTYYEAGNYGSAIEWLAQRTIPADPPGPWIAGARYNLARCYEQLGQLDLARDWLLSDADSPQRHGNLLRAKALEKPSD